MNTAVSGVPIFLGITLMLQLLHLGCSQFLDPACGIRTESKIVQRVINGQIATYNSSPWMVFLKSTDGAFVCGGTLITNRLVLTAAHCLQRNQTLFARLGEYKRSAKDGECVGTYCHVRVKHKVDGAFKPRRFDSKMLWNDIAILRLEKPVVYRANIRPICILVNTKWRKYIDSIPILTGTGWGITEDGNDSDFLRTLDIRRQPPQVCRQYIGANIVGNQFCAGNRNSNLCNGDSGGPLGALVPYKNSKRYVQIGIASFTRRKCEYASVYTNVMSHIDFILKVWRNFGNGQKNRPQIRPSTRAPNLTPTRPPTRPPIRPPVSPPIPPPISPPIPPPPILPPPILPPIPPAPNPPYMPPIPEPNFGEFMPDHGHNHDDWMGHHHEGHSWEVDFDYDFNWEPDWHGSHEYFD
ncbi:serine protease grass [Drosophila teissieri]|uniref:serine protease grass n=1 Tax=Drosophila teissieri TaxID=7243 RepID=UPI001CBA48D4|nr:serine protease grass [Drosophila teissieri]